MRTIAGVCHYSASLTAGDAPGSLARRHGSAHENPACRPPDAALTLPGAWRVREAACPVARRCATLWERRDEAAVGSGSSGQRATRRRAIGSAGERLVHTEEVTGSIPVSPTQLSGQLRSCNWPFWILVQQQSAATGLRIRVQPLAELAERFASGGRRYLGVDLHRDARSCCAAGSASRRAGGRRGRPAASRRSSGCRAR